MTSSVASRNFSLACLVFITLTGFLLRIHDLNAVPLRGDEAFSAEYWAGLPLTESLTRIARIEPHPPLTYAIFSLWGSLVGIRSEFALRFLPAIINLLGVPAMYVLAKRLFGEHTGLLAALVWAIHPFEIWHARDFRNYALWGALSTFTIYFGWYAITKNTRRHQLLYFAFALFTSLTFYFELFTVVAITIWGILTILKFPSPHGKGQIEPFSMWRRAGLRFRGWLLLNIMIIGITALVFVLLQGRLFVSGGYGGNTATFDLTALLTVFPSSFVFGETLPQYLTAFLSIAILLFLAFALWTLRYKHTQFLFLLCLLIIPIALLAIVSLRVSVFIPRYVMVAVVPITVVLVGGSVHFFKQGNVSRFAVSGVGLFAIFVVGISLNNLYNSVDYRKSPDWYSMRDYFAEHIRKGDIIIQTTVDASFGYYINPLTQTAAIPSTPNQTSADIKQVFQSLEQQTSTLWLYEHSYYVWENAKSAREWLNANWQLVSQTTVMGQPLSRYMPKSVTEDELKPSLDIAFEDIALLRSVRLEQTTQDLAVWLYWQPPIRDAYKASVQLIGDINPDTDNPIWAQSDLPLPNNSSQTRDVRLLDLSTLPSGNYTLILKVYDPANNQIVLAGSQEYYKIADITILH